MKRSACVFGVSYSILYFFIVWAVQGLNNNNKKIIDSQFIDSAHFDGSKEQSVYICYILPARDYPLFPARKTSPKAI